ncbi:ribonuclease R [Butyrivibrio sp. AE2032]|uniref:ribonuclease R n=1 Tax=Butyrivibrio sp. AE2032 TaxID=1458463 RepID=UPI0006916D33|nr:ribonuclease R [Butyrivibrio sp. AE2032]
MDDKKKRPAFAENMSAAQRRRNRVIKAKEEQSALPPTLADMAPRGPLQVKNQVIGILRQTPTGGVVIPDPAFRSTDYGAIEIDKNHLNGAPFNMVVVCEVLNPNCDRGDCRGTITEVLGDAGNNDVRMLTVLRQFGLSQEFPQKVIKEVEPLPVNPDPSQIADEIVKGRKDKRELLTITIDGEDAKDLDDAISIEKMRNGNFRLYVHIADVSNYVKEGTALDMEAFSRGTSVYLVDRVIPMLPPKLSNGLCSLNPNVDRLAMTAEMLVDREGGIYGGEVYESVIRSDRRMSYKECYRILTDPQPEDDEEYGEIIPMLILMKELAEILKSMRDRRGAIGFEMPETKVILNDDGTVKDIMPYPINFTNGIIESFMICANEFIAKKFFDLNFPFVYRVHEDPDPIKIARFSNIARFFGASGRLVGRIKPIDVQRFMDTIGDKTALPALDELLLRSMAKARYCSDCLGHFGLASKYYCHFTSPIRRYPDLYIHRIIKSYLHGENSRSHFAGLVDNAAEHSSDMERNAVDAERASDNIKICEYMADRIGEHYDGVISSIIDGGCFVRLENTVEGFVPFRSLHDHYIFDDRSYRAIGAHGGKILSIGMPVTIVVEKVDTEENKIDFSFEYGFEEERTYRETNAGKKAKEIVKKGRKGGKGSAGIRPGGYGRKSGGTGGRSGSGGFAGRPKSHGGRSGRGGGRGRR